MTVWDACESSLCNTHVGMGFDLHYHGDPGPSDECLYQARTAAATATTTRKTVAVTCAESP